ncbi:hypothetical protein [Echinimonas agarilytica]|uniref:DUF4145 domain-containing protein n=1 Tax=Echinimonas agarilytica TaxID=1215918 RepID=A0AA42B8P3_9GAMM|nr:hypothetical protein [Echinimonas agarilytica]MCM2681112.1 hypothetical protein [Echinimonas agarilytica]
MDWKTFIAQIIGSIAWPIVVIIIVWLLKDKLGELLPRLKKLKHKETEFEFAEKITELVSERKEDEQPSLVAKTREAEEQFDFLMKLAEISPRSAVMESFRALESASEKAVVKAYPELDTKNFRNPMEIQKLLKGKVLPPELYHRTRELRMLRNKAAHMEDFNLHGMPIEAYIDISLSIANQLEQYEP